MAVRLGFLSTSTPTQGGIATFCEALATRSSADGAEVGNRPAPVAVAADARAAVSRGLAASLLWPAVAGRSLDLAAAVRSARMATVA